MDDMNMNNEPPVYDSGDMKPTDPSPPRARTMPVSPRTSGVWGYVDR